MKMEQHDDREAKGGSSLLDDAHDGFFEFSAIDQEGQGEQHPDADEDKREQIGEPDEKKGACRGKLKRGLEQPAEHEGDKKQEDRDGPLRAQAQEKTLYHGDVHGWQV